MLPLYNLVVDIISPAEISEEQFREQIAPSLTYLQALMGAFGRSPCSVNYYPPNAQSCNSEREYWSVRAVVAISLGKQRAESLIQLYEAIVRLIELELPHFEVRAEISKFQFS